MYIVKQTLDYCGTIFLYIAIITIYRHIASLQGRADGPYLTPRSNAFPYKTAATGDTLRPNYTLLLPLDCMRSPIEYRV
jgi:hypothetical protein